MKHASTGTIIIMWPCHGRIFYVAIALDVGNSAYFWLNTKAVH